MKKVLKNAALWFDTILLVGIAVMLLEALSFREKARQWPIVVCVAVLVLGIIALIIRMYPKWEKSFSALLLGSSDVTLPGESEKPEEGAEKRVVSIAIWFVGYFFCIYFVGFNIATGVFVFRCLKILGKVGWIKSFLLTMGTWVFVYLLFDVILKTELFKGIFFGEIPPLF